MNMFSKVLLILIVLIMVVPIFNTDLFAQCSICTRTAEQLGERPAKALNTGVLYLAAAPLMIAGFIGYRWWKSEDQHQRVS